MAAGSHPFPFRTRKLSPPAPMVLGGRPPGRVGRRRITFAKGPSKEGPFAVFGPEARPLPSTGASTTAPFRPEGAACSWWRGLGRAQASVRGRRWRSAGGHGSPGGQGVERSIGPGGEWARLGQRCPQGRPHPGGPGRRLLPFDPGPVVVASRAHGGELGRRGRRR